MKSRDLEQQVVQVREAGEKRNAALEAESRRLRLLAQFGTLMVDIQKANFGDARDHAAKAFDTMRTAASAEADATKKQRLEALAPKRDQLIAELTALNPAALGTAQAIYSEVEAASR